MIYAGWNVAPQHKNGYDNERGHYLGVAPFMR